MKTLHFFLSLLFFSILPLYAQDELDSLKLIANNKEINDSTRIVAIATIIDFTVPSKERQEYTNLLGELSRKNYKKQTISKEAREFFTSYLAVYYTNLSSDYNITEYQKSIGYLR